MSEEPIEALLEREFETTGGYRLQLAHALPEIAAYIRAQAAEIERLLKVSAMQEEALKAYRKGDTPPKMWSPR